MYSPLDDDWREPDSEKAKLSTYPVVRAVGYLVVMLAGELAFEYWFTRQLSIYSIRPVLSAVLMPLLVSGVLELFRWWRYRLRVHKGEVVAGRDPFWFQMIEGAMAIWLLFVAAAFIRLYLL